MEKDGDLGFKEFKLDQELDSLEYVKQMKKLGGCEKMAEAQVRYYEQYVHKTVREYISDLHYEIKLEMKDLKYQLLIWQIGIGITIMSANFAMLKVMLR